MLADIQPGACAASPPHARKCGGEAVVYRQSEYLGQEKEFDLSGMVRRVSCALLEESILMELLAFAAVLTLVLASAIAAVLLENLLHAAIALGVGSALLAVALFLLGAPYAGSFELSVGAGLISVLFVVAVTLTESVGSSRRER